MLVTTSCKSGEVDQRSESAGQEEAPARAPTAEAPPTAPAPEEPAATEPAAPEPSTPEEIDLALKSAMVEGRDLDVLKYCELAGIEPGKGDGQAQLGCALAACRTEQAEKARMWSKGLPKPLLKQAAQICLANQIAL
jgi:hypothetical protein